MLCTIHILLLFLFLLFLSLAQFFKLCTNCKDHFLLESRFSEDDYKNSLINFCVVMDINNHKHSKDFELCE